MVRSRRIGRPSTAQPARVSPARLLRRRMLCASAGLLLDRLVGEPRVGPHPVSVFGSLMRGVERLAWRDSRVAGSLHAMLGAAFGIGCGKLLGCRAAARVGGPVAAVYLAVAGKGLAEAAEAVGSRLESGDIDSARELLPSLVGRDTAGLDDKQVTRAVVESVAENTVDAVVAPVVWASVAGAPGATCYRAVNTMDAMIGRRDETYGRYGWASARLDDLCGWLPARITAALVASVRPRRAAAVWRVVRQDAPSHPSPNAGVVEAAFAAALGVRLGGANAYHGEVELRPALGDGRPPELADIATTLRLSRDVAAALGVVLCVPSAALAARRASRILSRGSRR